MQIGNYHLHRRALIAFQELQPEEQAQVRDRLLALDPNLAADWPATLARKVPGERPRYLVQINDSLRALVELKEGQQPEVLDIIPQEWLDFLAQSHARAGA
jgi:hypothetical protein